MLDAALAGTDCDRFGRGLADLEVVVRRAGFEVLRLFGHVWVPSNRPLGWGSGGLHTVGRRRAFQEERGVEQGCRLHVPRGTTLGQMIPYCGLQCTVPQRIVVQSRPGYRTKYKQTSGYEFKRTSEQVPESVRRRVRRRLSKGGQPAASRPGRLSPDQRVRPRRMRAGGSSCGCAVEWVGRPSRRCGPAGGVRAVGGGQHAGRRRRVGNAGRTGDRVDRDRSDRAEPVPAAEALRRRGDRGTGRVDHVGGFDSADRGAAFGDAPGVGEGGGHEPSRGSNWSRASGGARTASRRACATARGGGGDLRRTGGGMGADRERAADGPFAAGTG